MHTEVAPSPRWAGNNDYCNGYVIQFHILSSMFRHRVIQTPIHRGKNLLESCI